MSSPKTTLLAVVTLIAVSRGTEYPTGVAMTGNLAGLNRAPACQLTDAATHDAATHDAEVAVGSGDVELAVEIDMSEFAYDCELPDIPIGTVVALRFTNVGTVEHEAVVGDFEAQYEAAREMAEGPGHDQGHGHGVLP